ncbi:MAG: acyl-ACP thioesterase domain-containing protein [Rectinemataceae bacterium]
MSDKPFVTAYRVRGYDCGYGGPFRPLSLANWFQEAAGDQATDFGLSMADMFAAGRTWMLSRTDTRIERLPREGEEVLVRTWPIGFERLFALRCIDMVSSSGELMAGAVYTYLIVDFASRRPLRPERVFPGGLAFDIPRPFADLAPGVGNPPDTGKRVSFRMRASPRHIDHNGHVNNGHLIDWLCDSTPRDARGGGELRRLKVDFLAEVLEGDLLEASWSPDAEGGGFGILSREGATVARSYMRWA